MDFCPLCIENDIKSLLTNIGIDTKVLICENDDCSYVGQFDETIVGDDGEVNLSNLNCGENDTFSRNKTPDCDIDFSTDSEDGSPCLSKKSKVNFTKFTVESVQRHLISLIKQANKSSPVFNWFGLPIMLKFNVKLCYFLIIHLDFFDYLKHERVLQLKEMYYQYEQMVSKVPRRLVSLVAFNFLKFLFDKHDIFKLANLKLLDMSERIVRSLERFMSSLANNGNEYKSIYHFQEQCGCCNRKMSYLREDFTVKVLTNFTFENGKFSQQIKCKKCFAASEVSITMERKNIS